MPSIVRQTRVKTEEAWRRPPVLVGRIFFLCFATATLFGAQPAAAESLVIGHIADASPPNEIEIEIRLSDGSRKSVRVGVDIVIGSTLSIEKWCATPNRLGHVAVQTKAGLVELHCGSKHTHYFAAVAAPIVIPQGGSPPTRPTLPTITSETDDPKGQQLAVTPAPSGGIDVLAAQGYAASVATPSINPGPPGAAPPRDNIATGVAPPQASAATPYAATPPGSSSSASTAAKPRFNWPVAGKVIDNYGKKSNGQQNDGINISVPINTPVRAADDGVVIYVGNDIKGYGNVVLVRHSNGYVTAYAHANELLVKFNDQVRRGQVIAKSGRSGNVSVPQLHFEVRRELTPVDPIPYLADNTARD